VLAEFLRDPRSAAQVTELTNGRGDSLIYLPGAGPLGWLQRRHEQGVGSSTADTEVVSGGWHRGPSSADWSFQLHHVCDFRVRWRCSVGSRGAAPAAGRSSRFSRWVSLGLSGRRSVSIEDRELLECASSEVAHVVNMVVLEQFHDAAVLRRPYWNLQQHVTVPECLVVDLEGRLVVAEPLNARTMRPRRP
jgi:hypothetical protein